MAKSPDNSGSTNDAQDHQPPAPKRFKFAPRQPAVSASGGELSGGPKTELRNYLIDLESLGEDTDAVQYWVSEEPQYKCIGGLALDLVATPASQAHVERLFSVCGDLTARKRNKTKEILEKRVFLKLNCTMLAKLHGALAGGQ